MQIATLVLAALAAPWVAAADVAGAWNLAYTNTEGQTRVSVLELKVAGEKLSGSIASARGEVELDEGRVQGDRITFTVIRKGNGDEITISFEGTVDGDKMKLQMQIRDRPPIPMTAVRRS